MLKDTKLYCIVCLLTVLFRYKIISRYKNINSKITDIKSNTHRNLRQTITSDEKHVLPWKGTIVKETHLITEIGDPVVDASATNTKSTEIFLKS